MVEKANVDTERDRYIKKFALIYNLHVNDSTERSIGSMDRIGIMALFVKLTLSVSGPKLCI